MSISDYEALDEHPGGHITFCKPGKQWYCDGAGIYHSGEGRWRFYTTSAGKQVWRLYEDGEFCYKSHDIGPTLAYLQDHMTVYHDIVEFYEWYKNERRDDVKKYIKPDEWYKNERRDDVKKYIKPDKTWFKDDGAIYSHEKGPRWVFAEGQWKFEVGRFEEGTYSDWSSQNYPSATTLARYIRDLGWTDLANDLCDYIEYTSGSRPDLTNVTAPAAKPAEEKKTMTKSVVKTTEMVAAAGPRAMKLAAATRANKLLVDKLIQHFGDQAPLLYTEAGQQMARMVAPMVLHMVAGQIAAGTNSEKAAKVVAFAELATEGALYDGASVVMDKVFSFVEDIIDSGLLNEAEGKPSKKTAPKVVNAVE